MRFAPEPELGKLLHVEEVRGPEVRVRCGVPVSMLEASTSRLYGRPREVTFVEG